MTSYNISHCCYICRLMCAAMTSLHRVLDVLIDSNYMIGCHVTVTVVSLNSDLFETERMVILLVNVAMCIGPCELQKVSLKGNLLDLEPC